MWIHLIVILVLVAACVLFGLLRADVEEEKADSGSPCGSCEEASSCGHFCFRRPMTRLRQLFRR